MKQLVITNKYLFNFWYLLGRLRLNKQLLGVLTLHLNVMVHNILHVALQL